MKPAYFWAFVLPLLFLTFLRPFPFYLLIFPPPPFSFSPSRSFEYPMKFRNCPWDSWWLTLSVYSSQMHQITLHSMTVCILSIRAHLSIFSYLSIFVLVCVGWKHFLIIQECFSFYLFGNFFFVQIGGFEMHKRPHLMKARYFNTIVYYLCWKNGNANGAW